MAISFDVFTVAQSRRITRKHVITSLLSSSHIYINPAEFTKKCARKCSPWDATDKMCGYEPATARNVFLKVRVAYWVEESGQGFPILSPKHIMGYPAAFMPQGTQREEGVKGTLTRCNSQLGTKKVTLVDAFAVFNHGFRLLWERSNSTNIANRFFCYGWCFC